MRLSLPGRKTGVQWEIIGIKAIHKQFDQGGGGERKESHRSAVVMADRVQPEEGFGMRKQPRGGNDGKGSGTEAGITLES